MAAISYNYYNTTISSTGDWLSSKPIFEFNDVYKSAFEAPSKFGTIKIIDNSKGEWATIQYFDPENLFLEGL